MSNMIDTGAPHFKSIARMHRSSNYTFLKVVCELLDNVLRKATEVKISTRIDESGKLRSLTISDNYVKGFEISFDKKSWFFTKRQDSTFKFTIAENIDTSDIKFYIRSIDNLDLADPEPDFLNIPIRY